MKNHISGFYENDTVDLLVVRMRKDKTVAIAKPCYDCLPIIQCLGIRYVYYTNRDGELVRESAANMTTEHRCSSHLARLAKLAKGV